MSSTFGLTEFCDDIRDEVDGKKSLIGVYTGDLFVDRGFPAIIPQLAVYVTLVEPFDQSREPVTVKVFVPGEKADQVIVDVDLPVDRFERADNISDSECLYSVLSFRMTPLLIFREGRIKVRAYKGSEEIKLGTILATDRRTPVPMSIPLELDRTSKTRRKKKSKS